VTVPVACFIAVPGIQAAWYNSRNHISDESGCCRSEAETHLERKVPTTARAFPGCVSVLSVDLWRSTILLARSVAASSTTWLYNHVSRIQICPLLTIHVKHIESSVQETPYIEHLELRSIITSMSTTISSRPSRDPIDRPAIPNRVYDIDRFHHTVSAGSSGSRSYNFYEKSSGSTGVDVR
jgi:hypothetical protein